MIAAVPYNVLAPRFIFLRGLKLMNFNKYQNYLDRFIEEIAQNYLDNKKIKAVINILRLIV